MPPRGGKKKTGDYDWVHQVHEPAQITPIHRRRAAGLEGWAQCPFNPSLNATLISPIAIDKTRANGAHGSQSHRNDTQHNAASSNGGPQSDGGPQSGSRSGASSDDEIVVTKDSRCQQRRCARNPRCYNHLGVDEVLGETKEAYLARMMGEAAGKREQGQAAGLRNLGATCYANAFLQVWFRNIKFRNGVYAAVQSSTTKTPLYHLAMIFASLQYSDRAVVDPTPLIDSLGLKKDDQQDAAEFSKLFTSLIADAFARHSDPSLKSLLNDMFEGKMEHSTTCLHCRTVSRRTESFLELDLNFKNNDTIEQCLERSFASEKLDGDNKYHCQNCDYLQDATRRSKPVKFPPVLNLTLMRFKYTASGRVKNKANIKYGKQLELGGVKYRLYAAVVHVGPSALHGHFKCDVYDDQTEQWLVCNDESVESPQKNKRRKLDVKSDQADQTTCDSVYMLVYKRDSEDAPIPPSRAILEKVEEDDQVFSRELGESAIKKERLDDEFGHIRGAQMEVIRHLPGTERIVARSLLERFFHADTLDELFRLPDLDAVTCYHEELDPAKGEECRLISTRAFDLMTSYFPGLRRMEPCKQCVQDEWARLKTSSDHADLRLEFDRLNAPPQEYVLPKSWLSAWRKGGTTTKLPTHPDDTLFCQHGARFENDSKTQIAVSADAIGLLRSVLGDFAVMKTDDPICSTCAASRAGNEEALRNWQAQVKDERVIGKLVRAHTAMVFGQEFWALPKAWWKEWEKWTKNPLLEGRRVELDMGVCEHGGLDWDPMMEWPKWVDERGWEEIKRRYGEDQPEVIIKLGANALPGKRTNVVEVTPPVCQECCEKRSLDFDKATIRVVFGREGEDKTMGSRRGTRSKAKVQEVEVTKNTTVKDIKLEICAFKGISPISQLLRYNARELDSSETIGGIGIGKHDEIQCEELEAGEMGADVGGRIEGFGGTALVGNVACPQCTLLNPQGSATCQVCDYPFVVA